MTLCRAALHLSISRASRDARQSNQLPLAARSPEMDCHRLLPCRRTTRRRQFDLHVLILYQIGDAQCDSTGRSFP